MASSQSSMLASFGKLTELKQRLLFVVGALIVFRLGSFIPIPGVNPDEMTYRDLTKCMPEIERSLAAYLGNQSSDAIAAIRALATR